jgi:acyl carrier protein
MRRNEEDGDTVAQEAKTLVKQTLKELMIAELNLVGKRPEDIDDTAPLFGAGLGLDSLDALQLAMVVEERFGVKVPEGEPARAIFASVDALVAHIVASRGGVQLDAG